jgi:hypothetical protein
MSPRPRWISLLVPGALAAIVLLGAGSATAAKVTNVRSTVTIKSGEGTEFTGKVNAAQKSCRSGRKVMLFREPYSGSKDKLVGTAKTDASGAWEMQGSYTAGIYHAQVASSFVHIDSITVHCLFAVGMSARF